MFSLKDKIVVITGSNGLLGRTIINSLREEGVTAIGADIQFDNQTEHDFIMDITNEISVRELAEKIVTKYGRIDGWLNNAYPRTEDWDKKLEDVTLESWRANIDMHLNGYFLCCQIVLMQMKKQGYGSLINMSSIYGVV